MATTSVVIQGKLVGQQQITAGLQKVQADLAKTNMAAAKGFESSSTATAAFSSRLKAANSNIHAFGQTTSVATAKAASGMHRFGTVTATAGTQASGGLKAANVAASGLLATLRPLLTIFGALSAINVVGGMIRTASTFEQLEIQLTTITGSAEDAAEAFELIQDFAVKTPFSLQDLTTGFVRLKSVGIEPTTQTLTVFADIAAGMGKSFVQWAEAVADAITGEFERLKEFGIKAKQESDSVTFTFQGMTIEVDKNAQSIQQALERIGKISFAGGAAAQTKSLTGALSNLGDAWDVLSNQLIRDSGALEAIGDVIRDVSGAVEEFGMVVDSEFSMAVTRIVGGIKDMIRWVKEFGRWWDESLIGRINNFLNKVDPTMRAFNALLDLLRDPSAAEETDKLLAQIDAIQRKLTTYAPDERGSFLFQRDLEELNRLEAKLAEITPKVEALGRAGIDTRSQRARVEKEQGKAAEDQPLSSSTTKAAAKVADQLEKIEKRNQDSFKKLAMQRLEFDIEMGRQTLETKRAILQEQLADNVEQAAALAEQQQMSQAKIADIMQKADSANKKKLLDEAKKHAAEIRKIELELANEKLRIEKELVATGAEQAKEQIESLGTITSANAEAALAQLQIWLDYYTALEGANAESTRLIKEQMAEVREQVKKDMEEMREHSEDQVLGISKRFTDLFADVLVESTSFKDGFIAIMKQLAKDLISTGLQDIIGSVLFPGRSAATGGVTRGGSQLRLQDLFGGLFGGAGSGGTGSPLILSSGPGGRAGGVGAAGIGGGFAPVGATPFAAHPALLGIGGAALLLPFLDPITEAIGGFGEGLVNVFTGGADVIGNAVSGFGSGLSNIFSGGLGSIGDVFTSFIGGLADALGTSISGLGGLGGALGGIGSIFKGLGGGLGSLFGGFGGFFQHGGSFVTQGPQLIGVGEVSERVSIRPLGGVQPDRPQVVFQGPVFMDEITMASFEKFIQRSAKAGAGSTI